MTKILGGAIPIPRPSWKSAFLECLLALGLELPLGKNYIARARRQTTKAVNHTYAQVHRRPKTSIAPWNM